jgi:hypothetical protein
MLTIPAPPSSSPRWQIDTATLEILNPKLIPLITLTAADRKWMDELVTLVDSSYNPSDPARPLGQGFVGSDDFLRGKFEEYVCSLLACVKFGEFLGRERGERAEMLLSAPGASRLFFFHPFLPFLFSVGRVVEDSELTLTLFPLLLSFPRRTRILQPFVLQRVVH